MVTNARILQLLRRGPANGAEIAIRLGVTRQAVNVFHARHPEVRIETQNLNPALSAMIRHVLDNSK